MLLFKSRHTPGLKNGKGVYFEKGEKVRYRMRDGTEYDIIIDSELMNNSGYWGFEAIFPDGRYFAVDEGIIDWDGKDSNQHDAYREALENIQEVVFDYNDNTEEKMDTLGKEFTEEKTTKKKKIIIIVSVVLSCIVLVAVSASITHNISYKQGYDTGNANGYNKGYNIGYNKGYDKGYEDNRPRGSDGSPIVYVTKSGTKYHKEKCDYLANSSVEISREQAENKGYSPCSKCRPDRIK